MMLRQWEMWSRSDQLWSPILAAATAIAAVARYIQFSQRLWSTCAESEDVSPLLRIRLRIKYVNRKLNLTTRMADVFVSATVCAAY